MALERFIICDEGVPNIPTGPFLAMMNEYIRGKLTRAEIITQLELLLTNNSDIGVITLTEDDLSDVNGIFDNIDAATTATEKTMVVLELRDVFCLAGYSDCGVYTTQEEIRVRLGLI